MARFYTSDEHFWHVRIREHCPDRGARWASLEEMNEALVERHNAVVGPSDESWHLGDFAMGKLVESVQIARRLNGHNVLLPGNHDGVFSGRKKGQEAARALYEDAGFEIVDEQVQHTIHDEVTGRDIPVLLCHFPYSGDHTEHERYPQHRPKARGMWLLHGHIHQHRGIDRDRRMINVGVDVPEWDYAPVSEQTIADVILGRFA